MKAMKATPPTTPPAIAPTFGPFDGGLIVLPTGGIHVECAHEWQVCGTREQISSFAHVGQDGESDGHCTHRLNIVLSVRSTSEDMLPLAVLAMLVEAPGQPDLRDCQASI